MSSITTGACSMPSIRGIEKPPDVGIDNGDGLVSLCERDCEVGGDRTLADTAFARRDEHHAGARVGVGEGNVTAFCVTVCGVVSSGRSGIALEHLADVLAFFIGHDGEVDRGAGHADAGKRAVDSVGDFVL